MARLAPRPTPPRERCGWPVHDESSTTVWWCGRLFGHTGPHCLFNSAGEVVSRAAGYPMT